MDHFAATKCLFLAVVFTFRVFFSFTGSPFHVTTLAPTLTINRSPSTMIPLTPSVDLAIGLGKLLKDENVRASQTIVDPFEEPVTVTHDVQEMAVIAPSS